MPKPSRRLAVLALPALLAACAWQGAEVTELPTRIDYICAGNKTLPVARAPDSSMAAVIVDVVLNLGAGVLNQPARGVAWLANRLAQYGDGIEAGQIVLAGSFIRPVEARHGDTIVGDFGPYGSVSLFFA